MYVCVMPCMQASAARGQLHGTTCQRMLLASLLAMTGNIMSVGKVSDRCTVTEPQGITTGCQPLAVCRTQTSNECRAVHNPIVGLAGVSAHRKL